MLYRWVKQRLRATPRLKDEKFGMLYGNHIRPLIRRRIDLSRVQGIIYGFPAKKCYTDTLRGLASYTETIYTLLGQFENQEVFNDK